MGGRNRDADAATHADLTAIGRNSTAAIQALEGWRKTERSWLYQAFLLNHDGGEIFALLSPNGENAIPVSARLLLR